MRLFMAGFAAVVALGLAVPSFAQQDDQAAPTAPVPATKPAKGTTAYCQSLKSSSQRSSCLKKLQAQAQPKNTTTAKKTKKKPAATPAPPAAPGDSAAYSPPPAVPPAPQGGPVAVPPLPQKTI